MHQGMDLSRFKKVASDKKTTTLRHAKGHEIKIAHAALTPKMREALNGLEMAEGGKVKRYAEGTPDEPVTAEEEPEALDAESPAAVDDGSTPEATASAPEEVEPATVQAPAPAAPQTPAAVPAAAVAPAEPTKLNMAQDLKQQDLLAAQDLALGHIKPETYHDLFAKKDTLGKIGTLFGLLVSGAGSGLAHQPNAVMEMMNRQIQNDFEAQKASASNAQNFLRVNQQHEMNQAQIKHLGAQQALTEVETSAMPSKVARTEAETGRMAEENKLTAAQARDVNIKAEAQARMLANRAALHKLVTETQKMPDGPAKQQAMQALGMMAQGVNTENFDIADRAAAMSALGNALNPEAPTPGANPEGQFNSVNQQLRMNGMDKIAVDREAKHMPGVQGQASVPLTGEDRNQIQGAQALMGSLERLKAFSKANPRPVKGSKADIEGKALAAQVQGDFRLATHGGVYKEGEQNFINQVVPGDPTTWNPLAHTVEKIDTVLNETKARNDQFLTSKGFNTGTGKQGEEGKIFVNKKTGERGKMVNGKIQPLSSKSTQAAK